VSLDNEIEVMKAVKLSANAPEQTDRFNRVLGDTVEALQESGIRYAFIGGVASGGLGRPRLTRDIDIFVRPEDAEATLRALAKHGFRTRRRIPAGSIKVSRKTSWWM